MLDVPFFVYDIYIYMYTYTYIYIYINIYVVCTIFCGTICCTWDILGHSLFVFATQDHLRATTKYVWILGTKDPDFL